MIKRSTIYISCMVFLITACKNKTDVSTYHSQEERDSLLADMITYIYIKPQTADWQTRFDVKYRPYYVGQLKDFRFQKYFINENGVHYFYLIRPARSAQGNIRGVGGSFKLQDGKIVSFKEIFNTPVKSLEELRTKGDELFKWMIAHGNVDDYVKNPDYIEWPDNMTYYDTIQHEWLLKPGL